MKKIIKYILAIIGSVLSVSLLLYSFVGFVIWIFSDPFNWIPDGAIEQPQTEKVQSPYDFENSSFYKDCKEKNGIPAYNPWGADKCQIIN